MYTIYTDETNTKRIREMSHLNHNQSCPFVKLTRINGLSDVVIVFTNAWCGTHLGDNGACHKNPQLPNTQV